MKKLLSLLLTLTLCFAVLSAVAEEPTVPEITNEPSYEAVDVAIGETGVHMMLPTDWLVLEVPEGYIAAYASADQTMSLYILNTVALTTCWDETAKLVEAELAKEQGEVYINSNYYMVYTTADDLYNFAYYPVSEEACIAFCFGVASADVPGDIALEILGTVHAAE